MGIISIIIFCTQSVHSNAMEKNRMLYTLLQVKRISKEPKSSSSLNCSSSLMLHVKIFFSSQKSVIFLSWSLLRSSSLQPRNHDYHGDYNFNCDHYDDDRHYITDHDHLIIMIIMAAIINNNNNLFSSTEWKRQWTDL